MIEHPIIFNSEMILAILAGRKWKTRRIMNPQPPKGDSGIWCESRGVWRNTTLAPGKRWKCPYGQPGDVLWVRESIRTITYQHGPDFDYGEHCIEYIADKHLVKCDEEHDEWWYHNWHVRPSIAIPSIHMPKWACRLKPPVVNVKVERVQDISDEDALVEGIEPWGKSANGRDDVFRVYLANKFVKGSWDGPGYYTRTGGPTVCFHMLWNSIHGPGAWDRNDMLWVPEFEKQA